MFSNNDKISPRQIKRLLIFHLFGVGSLLLPARLAKTGGTAGLWSVFLGMALAAVYLWMLQISCGRMKQDYFFYLQNGWGSLAARIFYICYALVSVFVSGWAVKLLAELVCDHLLEDGEFKTALFLVILLVLYGGIAGMEARARIYEILFWVLAVPLVIMLVLCFRQVQVIRWFPMMPEPAFGSGGWNGLWQGAVQCFMSFLPLTFLLFLKSHEQEEKKTGHVAFLALFVSGGAVAAIYLILLGIFGSRALSQEHYPIITLMGMVKIPGDFVKRLDAVMISVWFFTLYALIAATLYYGAVIARRGLAKDGSDWKEKCGGRWFWAMTALLYAISYAFYQYPQLEQFAGRAFYLAGVPFLVLVPLLSLMICRKQAPKKRTPNGPALERE